MEEGTRLWNQLAEKPDDYFGADKKRVGLMFSVPIVHRLPGPGKTYHVTDITSVGASWTTSTVTYIAACLEAILGALERSIPCAAPSNSAVQ